MPPTCMFQQLTCIFWTPTHMLHCRDTHLFTRTTDPMTLTCRGLHLNAYGRHSAVRFSHQQHLHLPCLPPKNPPSGLNLTKISLPARTSFVVRTYILTPALSPTNSAFRCTWQQVLLTFPPLGTSPRLCGPSASLTTYVAPASHSQSGSAVGCSSQARTRVTRAMTFDSNRGPGPVGRRRPGKKLAKFLRGTGAVETPEIGQHAQVPNMHVEGWNMHVCVAIHCNATQQRTR
jgi:hypothetical protein